MSVGSGTMRSDIFPAALWMAATLVAAAPAAIAASATEVFVASADGGTVKADAEILLDTARERGEIAVIVKLRADFVPEGDLSLFQAANQRSAIANIQRRVLDRIGEARNLKAYQSVPMMALTVDTDGLEALLENPNVEAVHEDVPAPPATDRSVSLIRADRAGRHASGHVSGHASGHVSVRGGAGWSVAVLDTGVVRNHPALRGKIVSEACYSTAGAASDSVCPGGAPDSTARRSGAACDPAVEGCDHGTLVAAVAVGNPAGHAGKGVARRAKLIPVQVFSRFAAANPACEGDNPCILSWASDQIAGLDRVNALASSFRIAAVSLSLGGNPRSGACNDDARKPIIDTLRSKGIAVVVAGGDGGADGQVSAPGCISSTVTVAGTGRDDGVSDSSNFSRLIDIAAPGAGFPISAAGDAQAPFGGTSIAGAHVAGAWALLKRAFPDASVGAVLHAMKCSGVKVKRAGITKKRVDVQRALKALEHGCR